MRDISFFWTSILLGNYFAQAENVYFQLLDKNVTADKSIAYEITKARNNSLLAQENKTYEIAQSSPGNDSLNKTEDTSRFGDYEPENKQRSYENVFNGSSNDISDITVPDFDEYETEITRKPLENIFKEYDDLIKKYKNYDPFKNIPNVPKIDPKIMEKWNNVHVDNYPELNDYYSRRNKMKSWLSLIGFFFLIIAGLCAASRKYRNHRSNVAENSSEDVSTALIVVIPKSGKDPKSTDS